MAVLSQSNEQDLFAQVQGGARLLMAFIECSAELQQHAKAMLQVLLDPESDEDDRFLASSTLADILFPNTHEGDKMLGLDLKVAEEIAKGSPEAAAALSEMDREEENFAIRLEAIMQQRGINQTELARRVGIGQSAISMMLKRACRPQKRTITRLAEALSVRPDDLWAGFSS
jgi:DNA-binding Xre family transcriptional regulator